MDASERPLPVAASSLITMISTDNALASFIPSAIVDAMLMMMMLMMERPHLTVYRAYGGLH